MNPARSHVGCAVVQDGVCQVPVQFLLEHLSALGRGDIALHRDHARQRLDLANVDAQNLGAAAHVLGGHLRPPTGRTAQINTNARIGQKVVFGR